jgi:hypothetical protein
VIKKKKLEMKMEQKRVENAIGQLFYFLPVESMPRFQSPSRSQDRLILIDASQQAILIGGRWD